jgi:hypothetical protein
MFTAWVLKRNMVRSQLRNGCHNSILAILAAAVVVGCSLLLASVMGAQKIMQPPSFGSHVNRRLGRRDRGSISSLGQLSDPKTVVEKKAVENRIIPDILPPTGDAAKSREYCQVVYITGVEGAMHHGVFPIIEALAKNQVDPESGRQYRVDGEPTYLRLGIFGLRSHHSKKWGFPITPDINDPLFVQRVVEKSCPDDGNKYVMIEWTSFPCGQEDDPRGYRVHRQHDWLSMSPDEIAVSNEALQHPLNVTAFVEAYSPYVDIKFVVIHRPFIGTIASHREWDGGAVTHSNIIHAFLLILRRFLDAHPFDSVTGGPLWTLLCLDRIMAKNYENVNDVEVARQNTLSHLADFLGWPVKECKTCFNKWHESKKDPYKRLGENVDAVLEHVKQLEGVWPPDGHERVAEQQCSG